MGADLAKLQSPAVAYVSRLLRNAVNAPGRLQLIPDEEPNNVIVR